MNNEQLAILTEAELAERWGVSPATVAKARKSGTGPKPFPATSHPRYLLSVIEEFEDGGLISKKQLAKRWGVTVRTIEKRDAAGQVPGRVKLSGLVRYRLNQIIKHEKGNNDERKPQ